MFDLPQVTRKTTHKGVALVSCKQVQECLFTAYISNIGVFGLLCVANEIPIRRCVLGSV